MKPFMAALSLLTLGGCALPQTVQKIGVDYNTAISGMADQVTLLNIMRAKNGLPIHYTSFSRLSASVTIKATGGYSAALKDASPTISSSIANDVVTTGLSTVTGGNTFTPSIGGEYDTNPSLDMSILESQPFYQGILSAVPFSTVQNFIDQGYDRKLVLSLLIQKIDLKATKSAPQLAKVDSILLTLTNAHGYDTDARNESDGFASAIKCNAFAERDSTVKDLVPLSRLTHRSNGTLKPLRLQDLPLFDGKQLSLSDTIPKDASKDEAVMVQRPSGGQDVRLEPLAGCALEYSDPVVPMTFNGQTVAVPAAPPADPIYLAPGYGAKYDPTLKKLVPIPGDLYLSFRSTEGLIQFLGNCLQNYATQNPDQPDLKCMVGKTVVFSVSKGLRSDAFVTANVLDEDFSISKADRDRRNTMQTIGLIQKLIGLQQSSTTAPSTTAVHVVP